MGTAADLGNALKRRSGIAGNGEFVQRDVAKVVMSGHENEGT